MSAQHMEMQVKNGLPRNFSVVGDHPVSCVIKSARLSSARSQSKQLGREGWIIQFAQAAHMPFRNDQHMHWRRRSDVVEHDGVLALHDELRTKLAVCDSAENALFVQCSRSPGVALSSPISS